MWTLEYREGEISSPWRRWCFYWVSQILFVLSNLKFLLSVGQFILSLWFGSRRRLKQSTSRKTSPPRNNRTLSQYSCAVSSPTSFIGHGRNDCSYHQQQFTFRMMPLSPFLHIKIFFKWLNFFFPLHSFSNSLTVIQAGVTSNMTQIRGGSEPL